MRLRIRFITLAVCCSLLFASRQSAEAAPVPFTVYLGFDNGPLGGATEALLDVLLKYNVKATFFIEGGHVAADPEALRREIQEGHHIGSHLWEHSPEVMALNHPDPKVLLASFQRTDDAIHTALGDALWQQYNQEEPIKPFFWPGLAIQAFPRADVITYNGNIVGGEDSPGGARVTQIIHSVLYGNPPISYGVYAWGNGAVIMMHDPIHNDAKALPTIIQNLRARGAVFGTLPRPGDTPGTMPIRVGDVPPCARQPGNCAKQNSIGWSVP